MMKIERILVRGTNWIGDAVMSTPALQRLRTSFPGSRISLLATPLTCELFAASPLVDEVIPYRRREEGRQAFFRALARLRRSRFDVALLFQNAFEAALLTWLAGIPHRVGFAAQGRGPLLTHPLQRVTKGRHQINDYLDIVAAGEHLFLGEEFQPAEPAPFPSLTAGEKEKTAATALLAGQGVAPGDRPLIALNVGATNSRAKCWPAERFAALAVRLADEKDAGILLIGGPGEVVAADEVAGLAKSPAVINLAGKTTLPELLGVLSQCSLLVSNDTGPAHIAAALGRPVLTIFGPTNEFETAPTGPRADLIRADGIECARCMHRDCPIDHRCMTRLAVEEVLAKARALTDCSA